MIRGAVIASSLAALCGCGHSSDGTGVVAGSFTVLGCKAESDVELRDYGYEVQHVVNRRIDDHLAIEMLEYPVDLEQTDGLIIQFESVAQLREARAQVAPGPLTVPLGLGNSFARAALSLFTTCPRAPTLHAVSGSVVFTRLELAADPADAGVDEIVTGTLTASVSGPDRSRVLGTISASFDFIPANAPQLTPR